VAATAENDTVGARLAAIVSQAQASLAVGRDKVAGLRARQDAAPLFPVALEQVASDQLDGSGVALTVTSHGSSWPMTQAVANECLAIVAEAVANVRKHAQAHAVRIDVHYGWRACTIAIADDGGGIPPEFLDGRIGHWGLIGMRERAGLIKARLDVSSSDAGTTLRLRVPRWRVGRQAS
jgi:signal transduction histidine kinase